MNAKQDSYDRHAAAPHGQARVSVLRPRLRRASPSATFRGFSLLELLVVIAMIALLIAILIPALVQARRRVNQLVCQTNLSTIAKGWHLYLAASGSKFLKSGPGLDNVQVNFGGKQGRIAAFQGPKRLNPSLHLPPVTWSDEAARIFRCPFDSGSGRAQPTFFDYQGSSYQMNHLLVGPPGPPGLQPKPGDPCFAVLERAFKEVTDLNTGSLANEAKLLLAGDCGWYNAWESGIGPKDHIDWHGRPMWHNLAFMDGHVKLTRIRKGMHTTSDYTVIPSRQEQVEVCTCQQEILCD
ncbi:MAG: type II secretion system protein [Phycisphaerae bacterium]|nr:type II secretion system protein [Phycisphaerae bacterium]